jgi:peptidoglycan hydrolase-like protein with peptidoglycan-binding domain
VLKRSWAGEVRNVSLLVAIGVNGEGYRDILGICEGAKEDKAGWSGFLKHLKERSLRGVRLLISDACMGLVESATEFFSEAAWQRCVVVHWYRNIFSHVPSTKVREIVAMLKAIHAGEDIAAARQKAVQVGLFGPATLAAVQNFQKAHSITVTGIVDAATAAAINAEVDALVPPVVKIAPVGPRGHAGMR